MQCVHWWRSLESILRMKSFQASVDTVHQLLVWHWLPLASKHADSTEHNGTCLFTSIDTRRDLGNNVVQSDVTK